MSFQASSNELARWVQEEIFKQNNGTEVRKEKEEENNSALL
jgi:hypothetical protein